MPGLNDILQLLQGGALEPQDALEMHFANEEARKAKRQETLGGLMDIGMAGAQEGMGLDQLVPMLSAQATFAGRPNLASNPKLVSGLDSLYDNQGQSMVAPPSVPEFTDFDKQGVAQDVIQLKQSGADSMTAFSKVMNHLSQQGLPADPNEIRAMIDGIYKMGY